MFTAPDARADNECGAPEGVVVCSPSTYDPAQGNIFYSHDENGMDETSGDFAVRLAEDLSINYDRRATAYKTIVPSTAYLGRHRSEPPGFASSCS